VLTIHVTGDLLSIRIKTSPNKVTTSTPVSFSADVTPKSNDLSYRWNFTGGTSPQDKTPTPSHTYTKKGSYSVNLEVTGDDGSYGRAATTTVKVGKPPKPSSNNGTGGTGGGGGGGTGGGGYIPPYIPNSSPNPPPVDNPPTTELPTTPTAPVDDGLTEVEGFVLAGAGAGEGEDIPGTQATNQPTKASELSTSRKISGAVIGALAVILLLGLGAEIETRWASTRLAHLRRRT
jgi:PKD repeat protein